jgi:hypothetical protein
MLYFCISNRAEYTTSVGTLGIFFSIAALFLDVQRAQAKPEKIKMIKLIEKGPLPLNPELQNHPKMKDKNPG